MQLYHAERGKVSHVIRDQALLELIEALATKSSAVFAKQALSQTSPLRQAVLSQLEVELRNEVPALYMRMLCTHVRVGMYVSPVHSTRLKTRCCAGICKI